MHKGESTNPQIIATKIALFIHNFFFKKLSHDRKNLIQKASKSLVFETFIEASWIFGGKVVKKYTY